MSTGWDQFLDERDRRAKAEAEVKRLEELILAADEKLELRPIANEARRIRQERADA